MDVLHTAHLTLRPLRADDINTVMTPASDQRVMAPSGGPLSAVESRTWLDRQLAHIDEHGHGRCVVTRGAEFVGLVGLDSRQSGCSTRNAVFGAINRRVRRSVRPLGETKVMSRARRNSERSAKLSV